MEDLQEKNHTWKVKGLAFTKKKEKQQITREKFLFYIEMREWFLLERGEHNYEKGQKGSLSKNQWKKVWGGINTRLRPMTPTHVARLN